jgi:hypothetical protein
MQKIVDTCYVFYVCITIVSVANNQLEIVYESVSVDQQQSVHV